MNPVCSSVRVGESARISGLRLRAQAEGWNHGSPCLTRIRILDSVITQERESGTKELGERSLFRAIDGQRGQSWVVGVLTLFLRRETPLAGGWVVEVDFSVPPFSEHLCNRADSWIFEGATMGSFLWRMRSSGRHPVLEIAK
jgi:hypothetical protein